MKVEELDTPEEEVDWMSRLLSSALFARLPPDNIQKFFTELEPLEVSAGDLIVEQGTEGDYLYIIAEGQCVVSRRASRPGNGCRADRAALRTWPAARRSDSGGQSCDTHAIPRPGDRNSVGTVVPAPG